jgi:hypothetical protein
MQYIIASFTQDIAAFLVNGNSCQQLKLETGNKTQIKKLKYNYLLQKGLQMTI